jgi:hypothetical protein
MKLWLLVVYMQMSDPNEDTYDDEMDAHSSDDEMDAHTSNDETDGELLVALYAVDIWGRHLSRAPRRTLVESGIQWVQRTLEISNDCFDMFRMRRTVFRRLGVKKFSTLRTPPYEMLLSDHLGC